MKKPRFNWFLLIRLAGIVLFITILFKTDIKEVWMQLKLIRWYVIAIALGFVILQLGLKAIRWHFLNKGTLNEKSSIRSFGEFFESYAIGIVTPGRLGELLKAGYSSDRSGKISTGVRVFVERGLDFGFFLCIAGLSLAWGNIKVQSFSLGLLTIFIGLLSVTISISLLSSGKIYLIIERLLIFLRISKHSLDYKVQSTQFSLYVVLISIVSNSVYFISCYFLAHSVLFDAGLLYISGGIAVSGLLNTIPMTVMGLGTREVTFLFIFSDYPTPVIMAFSVLIFLCWQVGSGLLALLAGEILLTRTNKKSIKGNHSAE